MAKATRRRRKPTPSRNGTAHPHPPKLSKVKALEALLSQWLARQDAAMAADDPEGIELAGRRVEALEAILALAQGRRPPLRSFDPGDDED